MYVIVISIPPVGYAVKRALFETAYAHRVRTYPHTTVNLQPRKSALQKTSHIMYENFYRACYTLHYMKLGIILQSNTPERVWNTFRLGITARKAGHDVSIFLMSEGAELGIIGDVEHFDVRKKVLEYRELQGALYACGSCLDVRGINESDMGSRASMSDLLAMIEAADTVLSF